MVGGSAAQVVDASLLAASQVGSGPCHMPLMHRRVPQVVSAAGQPVEEPSRFAPCRRYVGLQWYVAVVPLTVGARPLAGARNAGHVRSLWHLGAEPLHWPSAPHVRVLVEPRWRL